MPGQPPGVQRINHQPGGRQLSWNIRDFGIACLCSMNMNEISNDLSLVSRLESLAGCGHPVNDPDISQALVPAKDFSWLMSISHSLERRIHLLGHDFISFWILLSFSWSCFCELLMKNYNSKKEMARVLTLDEASVRLGHSSHITSLFLLE